MIAEPAGPTWRHRGGHDAKAYRNDHIPWRDGGISVQARSGSAPRSAPRWGRCLGERATAAIRAVLDGGGQLSARGEGRGALGGRGSQWSRAEPVTMAAEIDSTALIGGPRRRAPGLRRPPEAGIHQSARRPGGSGPGRCWRRPPTENPNEVRCTGRPSLARRQATNARHRLLSLGAWLCRLGRDRGGQHV